MAKDFVCREVWKGGRLTAPALAAVERAWQQDSTAAARFDALTKLMANEIDPGDIRCAGRLIIKDTDVTGLELRLSRTGAWSWALSMRRQGVQRRFTLEGSADMTLAEARKAAAEERIRIQKGADPVEERREARRTAAAARVRLEGELTLNGVLDEFEKAVARPKKQRSWNARRKHLEAEYRRYLSKPAADLKAEHVRPVLDAAAKRESPVAGWHGFRYLRRIMSWAVRRGHVPADPTASIEREEVLDTVRRENQRDRVLSPSELQAIWSVLEDIPESPYACIYRLILLTGQRPNEVATMQWADVDLDRAEWVQTSNKSDRRHLVPLSPEALAIVTSRKAPGPHVFTTSTRPNRKAKTATPGGRLDARSGNWDRFTKMVAANSGTAGWSRHDLRRTSATLLAEARTPPVVIEQLLNHSEGAGKGGMIASIYNRHNYLPEKRHAVEKLAEIIGEIARGDRGKIIDMRSAKVG